MTQIVSFVEVSAPVRIIGCQARVESPTHDAARMTARSGGELIVASLLAQGATHAFGVPGESYLPVLDALHDVRDRLQFVICRQEGGAAYMAEAYGKLTGTPGLAVRHARTGRDQCRRSASTRRRRIRRR